ncbi:MAG: trypsin-like peptidase domain-containing protein [Ruminococcus sp.]|nr:trypsin-like peptidase domain-containing protein [Ruminococcus sp.]
MEDRDNNRVTEDAIAEDILPDEKKADDNASEAAVPQRSAREKLIYLNRRTPDPDKTDFWSDVTATKPRRSFRFAIGVICICLLILTIFAYSIAIQRGKGWFMNIFRGRSNIEFTLPIADTPSVPDNLKNPDGTFTAAGLAEQVMPSVVQIKTYAKNAIVPDSQGSGIIMSSDGYIITNAHVVSGEHYGITIMLSDKTEYAAKLVGADDSTDIAVLKVNLKDLTPAQFADSDLCKAGDEVVAIGSPAGYENSITKGIISGLNRQIRAENSATAMNCIQIDAAINPGNSGGPLLNMWGQVIGITSSKLVAESYDNIGFAITTNSAKPIIEMLMEDGYVPDRGRMGISYYAITSAQAELYGLKCGIYVASIDSKCNIAKTELEEGDIIVEIDGVEALDTTAVSEIMSKHKAGDEITCKVFRPSDDSDDDSGESFEITFELNSDKTAMIEAKKNKDKE